jgi:hypothetical protein
MRKALRRSVLPMLAMMVPALASAQRGSDASSELIGSRSGANVVEGGAWAGTDMTISWNITALAGGLWNYSYTFTGFGSPGISHIIIALSSNCATSTTSSDGTCVRNPLATIGNTSLTPDGEIGTFTDGAANPGLANNIFGVKFNTPGQIDGQSGITFSFTSERVPVYGDFYAKGGNDTYAMNSGLLSANFNSTNNMNFIARPDGVSTVTPEPASVVLLASGLGALGIAGYRRRRQS